MTTTAAILRDRAITILQTVIDGTGVYTNNFTDEPANRVAIGNGDGAPVPSIRVRIGVPIPGEDGLSLNRIQRSLDLVMVCTTASESGTKAKEDAALDIAQDVSLALERMRTWTDAGTSVDIPITGRIRCSIEGVSTTGNRLTVMLTCFIPYDTTGGF